VLEKDPNSVGGLCRTVNWNSFRFDIGGHRFYTESEEVQGFWSAILGDDLLPKERLSRILHDGKDFAYPLDLGEVLTKLNPYYGARCLGSYLLARFTPSDKTSNYEEWMVRHFGKALFETFFRDYTEKVWGVKCSEISSDWASQRTKGVSLLSVLRKAIGHPSGRTAKVRSFTDTFYYPRLGAGQLWDIVAGHIQEGGGEIRLGSIIEWIDISDESTLRVQVRTGNTSTTLLADEIISSIPLPSLLLLLRPAPPEDLLSEAAGLHFRDFILVALKLKKPSVFAGQWMYVQEKGVRVARIQDYRNWSEGLIPNSSQGLIGMEYFCFEKDDLWSESDDDLVSHAIQDAEHIGLLIRDDVEDGKIIRMKNAYPIYHHGYRERVNAVKAYLSKRAPRIQTIGRSGTHRYNNQDHSIMTGFLAAQNIIENTRAYDPFQVNEEAVYLEVGCRVTVENYSRF